MQAFNQVRLGGWTIGTPTHSTESNDKEINPSNKRKKKGTAKTFRVNTILFLDRQYNTLFGLI